MNYTRRKFTKIIISAIITVTALATSAFAATVTANEDANVRTAPNPSAEQIGTLEAGSSRTVISTSGNWVKVQLDDSYGYINTKFLTTSIASKNTKTTDEANLRALPSSDSEITAVLPKGTSVTLSGISGSWYKVKTNDMSGFIHKSNLDLFSSSVCSKAASLLGSRYVYGATGPNAFDCSGFTSYVYRACGKSIPRTSSSQYASSKKISKANLKPGQLVFFSGRGGGSSVGHVGIYVGDGYMIHAANSSTGVIKSSLSSAYYASRYIGAGYY